MSTDLRGPKEKAFFEALARKNITIQAFIQRTQHDWAPAFYVFRFKKADSEWVGPIFVPWQDHDSFPAVLEAIDGARKSK